MTIPIHSMIKGATGPAIDEYNVVSALNVVGNLIYEPSTGFSRDVAIAGDWIKRQFRDGDIPIDSVIMLDWEGKFLEAMNSGPGYEYSHSEYQAFMEDALAYFDQLQTWVNEPAALWGMYGFPYRYESWSDEQASQVAKYYSDLVSQFDVIFPVCYATYGPDLLESKFHLYERQIRMAMSITRIDQELIPVVWRRYHPSLKSEDGDAWQNIEPKLFKSLISTIIEAGEGEVDGIAVWGSDAYYARQASKGENDSFREAVYEQEGINWDRETIQDVNHWAADRERETMRLIREAITESEEIQPAPKPTQKPQEAQRQMQDTKVQITYPTGDPGVTLSGYIINTFRPNAGNVEFVDDPTTPDVDESLVDQVHMLVQETGGRMSDAKAEYLDGIVEHFELTARELGVTVTPRESRADIPGSYQFLMLVKSDETTSIHDDDVFVVMYNRTIRQVHIITADANRRDDIDNEILARLQIYIAEILLA